MASSYNAILKGDHVEWLGEAPNTHDGVAVRITVLNHSDGANVSDAARRQQVGELLASLVARGTFSEIADPVAWQQEIRKDRALPGREE